MRAAGIAGYVKKRKVRTTGPEPADQLVPDLLKRDFTADAPNRRYVGDITYLPLAEAAGGHNLYLATVIDCYSRRLVGWAIADLGVTQSMGAVSSSADNALAESFNAALKRGVLQDAKTWPDREDVRGSRHDRMAAHC
ncbi:MAG: putative transposase orfB for insertion sequence element [Nocardioides sp.]|nr:putative transposase orfB for insertion sequence element [Nocardioides sp.]